MNSPLKDEILRREFWIFDMDGTLTIAAHDFDEIRDQLGLPPGRPILESLAAMPENEAAPLHARLNEIELEIAARSRPADGAQTLLNTLRARGTRMGILTRNNTENVRVTLRAAGLDDFFAPEHVVSRDDAEPKPSPAGLLHLMTLWNASPENVVMLGDYLFDLQAGKAAGAAVVYIDPAREFPFREHADMAAASLEELAARI